MLFELFITNCFQLSLLLINHVYNNSIYHKDSKLIQKRQIIHDKSDLKCNWISILQI